MGIIASSDPGKGWTQVTFSVSIHCTISANRASPDHIFPADKGTSCIQSPVRMLLPGRFNPSTSPRCTSLGDRLCFSEPLGFWQLRWPKATKNYHGRKRGSIDLRKKKRINRDVQVFSICTCTARNGGLCHKTDREAGHDRHNRIASCMSNDIRGLSECLCLRTF